MQSIEKAYETYYTQNLHWPDAGPQGAAQVAPLLKQGLDAFNSPWPGVTYQVSIIQVQQTDGTSIERPLVQCQPPGQQPIQVPER